MSNLLFLLVPIAVAATAVTVMWLRARPTTSPTAGIDQFSVQMRALAPEDTEPIVTPTPAEPARPPTGHAVVIDDTAAAPADEIAGDAADDPAGDAAGETADEIADADEIVNGTADGTVAEPDDEPAGESPEESVEAAAGGAAEHLVDDTADDTAADTSAGESVDESVDVPGVDAVVESDGEPAAAATDDPLSQDA